MRDAGTMRGLPIASAGLQLQDLVPLRNDKGKVEWFRKDPLGCLETIDIGLSFLKAYSLVQGVGGFSGGSGSQVNGMGTMLAGYLNGMLG